jgi:hypothetical protein
MLLRSMGPGVIATDEIGSDEDARAVGTALSAGASVLATCHGDDVESLRRRPHSSWLVSSGYFERVVVLSRRWGRGQLSTRELSNECSAHHPIGHLVEHAVEHPVEHPWITLRRSWALCSPSLQAGLPGFRWPDDWRDNSWNSSA